MKKSLETKIKNLLRDLEDYHQNTFDMEGYEPYRGKEKLTGEEVYDYTYDIEMTKQEDACYLMGKIEAYRDILRILDEEMEAKKVKIVAGEVISLEDIPF